MTKNDALQEIVDMFNNAEHNSENLPEDIGVSIEYLEMANDEGELQGLIEEFNTLSIQVDEQELEEDEVKDFYLKMYEAVISSEYYSPSVKV